MKKREEKRKEETGGKGNGREGIRWEKKDEANVTVRKVRLRKEEGTQKYSDLCI